MGAAESRALLMGGMKRASSVEDPRDDKKAKVEKTKVLDIQDFNVGIEIETCCNQIPHLQYFKEEKDPSIQCLEGNEVEFILRYDNRKYFQQRSRIMREMDNIVKACRMCAPSKKNPKHTTCGVHIHLSHPLATKREYAQFDRYFSRYWMSTLYDALRQTYNLRLYNTYCRENTCYHSDRRDKYRQLNLSPTSEEDDDLWHFEFRGMGDIHRVDVATVDKFIHALANGYKMAFGMYNHKPAPVNYEWKKELEALLYENDEPPIEEVSELLTEARAAGSPIDLDKYGANLNSILYYSSYGDISDVPHLKEILSQAKNWDAYFDKDDNTWNSPLIWITWKDDESKGYEMSLALLPFLKEKGYTISSRVIDKLPKPVVTAWGPISFDWKKELRQLLYDNYEGPPIEEVSE